MRDRDAVSQTVESYWGRHSVLTFSLRWTCVHIYKMNMYTHNHLYIFVHLLGASTWRSDINWATFNKYLQVGHRPGSVVGNHCVWQRHTGLSSCADSTGCGQASICDTAVSKCRSSLGFSERRLLWGKACLSFSSLPLVKGVTLWTVAKVRTHGDKSCSWSSLLHYSAVSLWLWRALAS